MNVSIFKLGYVSFRMTSTNFLKKVNAKMDIKKVQNEKKKKKEIDENSRRAFFGNMKKKNLGLFLLFFFFFNFPSFANDFDDTRAFSTKSGLKILEYVTGEGKTPEWGNLLVINYVMYELTPGGLDQIDSTFERNQPFLFSHGGGQIIRGIEEAVHDMRIGGKRRVILPEDIGYVTSALGPVPPLNFQRKKVYEKKKYDTPENKKFIIFDIELVDIKKNFNKLGNFSTFSLNKTEIRKLFSSD